MATALEPIRDVILRDGSTLRLRPPTAGDEERLLAFYRGLSEHSVYLRFHGFPSLSPELVAPLLDPDWSERGALIGTLGAGTEERVVAVANFVRLRDPGCAEVAFTVADELQGHGVGTRLLEQLAECAAKHGIRTFIAEVMSSNTAMLQVFADAGFAISRRVEHGAVEVRLSLVPTGEYRERVDYRDHLAVTASLKPFFEPRTVAVIGASRRRGSIGGELFRNILQADFTGAAYPVNTSGEPVAGVRTYRSITDIPEEIDLAVICLPGEHVLQAAEEALTKGTKALCVISAGFAETGPEGARRQERLLEMARAHGARVVGPNCLGIAVSRCRLNATFGSRPLPPGNVGYSSQSGALGLALLEAADSRGVGLSAFVSVGNKADVSSNDLLEYWEDDPDTDLVLLYLESFGNPRKFARLARRVARKKPILAMKGGRTRAGARAAGSHTAALAGSEHAVDALFQHAGVIRADTLEELVDVAAFLSTQPLPRGRRVALLTNAGGLGILGADACEAAGLELAPLSEETRRALTAILPLEASVANPVDMLGSATEKTFEAALPHVLADPGIDAVIVLFVPVVVAEADAVAAAVVRTAEVAGVEGKPVLGVFVSRAGTPPPLLRGDGVRVAAFPYPEAAARALGRAAERAEWLRRPAGTVPELAGIDEARAAQLIASTLAGSSDVWLEPGDVRALLAAYGIPFVGERLASTADEAVAAASELGYPVVVKTAEVGVHKTERGLLALNLADEEAVRRAVADIGLPVVVQRMVTGGAELLAGVVQDPVFGPLVAFGPGGVFAELIGDAQFRLAPLTDVDADELVRCGKVGKLVAGYRGAPASDAAALADLLLRLSQLADNHPEVSELDLNPVVGLPAGCLAVDARIRLRPAEPQTRAKTW
ncbi:MAG TPA: GNAT family N-acetyltransferase [Gaiellaceae bacterium]|nr:GNAT family N-acetyltransferase [Gaiellaceae bacterium]